MKDETYYQMARPEIVPLVPRTAKRILEIGCAAGCFRRNFGNEIEYWGVEPVNSAAEQAKANGVNVLAGTYENVSEQIPNGYFDVVVCNDVIEHVVDTEAFLTSLKRKLAVGRCLVGSIPNIRFVGTLKMLLFRRDWQYEDSGIMDRTHVRFFTPKSFRRVLQENGFLVDVFGGIGSRKLAIVKFVFKPLLWIVGEDLLHMQYAFRAILPVAANVSG